MQSDTVPLINKKRGKKKLTRLKKSILGFLACAMLLQLTLHFREGLDNNEFFEN